ncbi:MAG TPA: hypothetical protein PKV98_00595, partial [Burkholderiaceae bacterium]|nr:hypothetical protein [Burkholderiaceae bacterium]
MNTEKRTALERTTLTLSIAATCIVAASTSYAQVLQGMPGAPTTLEFPNSRVLPVPTPPFAGDIQ